MVVASGNVSARAVVLTGAGGNDVVEVQERPLSFEPQQVIVRVQHAGMNPADVHQREGYYPAPPGVVPDVPGLEVAGVIEATGDATTRWASGDRVFGLVAGGGLADRVAVHERHLARIPDELTLEEAAAVPEACVTAHDALTTQGGIHTGAWVLVQGASGAVGSAAVQIAQALGARALGVTRSDRAAESVKALGAESVDAAGFADAVLARTDGKGVDLILELVGGSQLAGDLRAIAVGGTIVIISVAAGARAEVDLLRLMTRRATIRGTVLRARSVDDKAAAIAGFARDVVPMLADRRVHVTVDSVFPVEDVHQAFDRVAQLGKRGKVLVSFG